MLHLPRLLTRRHGTGRRGTLSAGPRVPALLAAILTLGSSTGCTSALTTTYLKGLPWDGGEHAAEIAADATTASPPEGSDEEPDAASVTADAAVATDQAEAAARARSLAVEDAVGRLAALGALDAATQATLVATLQRTNQEDWPAVVDEFTAVLAAGPPRIAAKPEVDPPVAPTSAAAVAAAAPAAPEPEGTDAPEQAIPSPSAPTPPQPAAAPPPRAEEAATPAGPDDPGDAADLVIRNACFASRVQAWGIADRFTTARFRPGQEVIVYFELEHLSASESAAGHTTCIDTALTLATADGRRLHAWHFEPIAETCPSRRRDYFARYVLRFPDDAPQGDCRVEVAVTDTLAGTTATTSLPLAIAAD